MPPREIRETSKQTDSGDRPKKPDVTREHYERQIRQAERVRDNLSESDLKLIRNAASKISFAMNIDKDKVLDACERIILYRNLELGNTTINTFKGKHGNITATDAINSAVSLMQEFKKAKDITVDKSCYLVIDAIKQVIDKARSDTTQTGQTALNSDIPPIAGSSQSRTLDTHPDPLSEATSIRNTDNDRPNHIPQKIQNIITGINATEKDLESSKVIDRIKPLTCIKNIISNNPLRKDETTSSGKTIEKMVKNAILNIKSFYEAISNNRTKTAFNILETMRDEAKIMHEKGIVSYNTALESLRIEKISIGDNLDITGINATEKDLENSRVLNKDLVRTNIRDIKNARPYRKDETISSGKTMEQMAENAKKLLKDFYKEIDVGNANKAFNILETMRDEAKIMHEKGIVSYNTALKNLRIEKIP